MNYRENVSLALESIKSNRLRTLLTAMIIAFGLMALVGILTTVDAIERKMTEAFSSMGANSFTIRNRGIGIRIGKPGQKPKTFESIRYEQAIKFRDSLKAPATVAVSVFASNGSTVKYGSEKTNPNINVQGIDQNGLASQALALAEGRDFSPYELQLAGSVCIIGSEIGTKLFKTKSPLNQFVNVGNNRFKIIGVLASKGSSIGFSGDRSVYVPLLKAKQINSSANPSYTITVMVSNNDIMENVIGEATALLRNIRKVKIGNTNNFEIIKSDAIAQTLMENLAIVIYGGVGVGIITLFGASIGLMNIMLVSVTERTREIGIRKAIGANPKVIRRQFLIEAVLICLMGGALGIFLGIMIGNLISLSMSGSFIIPWLFIFGGFALCILVGIASGYYPANKASKLDPVDALRYE
ncbi:FtsX-like permease family protein [Pedobacter changchengzhani]|uniref:FtsX-like permease family protein n=1 Tax=Pedobacter changchengzhani TaxID=2529274 RepID=A0A4R5MQC9_9SPHI|nr:ABC transporter permease [Pedobacter changchengzhani]TDG37938.1 FtsX-like permease family protein [Pedobacter changchengzhani]